MVEGGNVFCAKCRHMRLKSSQRNYRRTRYSDPLPPGPPTSMDWLRKFGGWIKSGKSYGDYQAAEREKKKGRNK